MKIIFKQSFLKTLTKNRNKSLKDDIADAIENVELAININEIRNIKKLKGHKDFYRIKIGSYRLGLKIEKDIVYFVDIDHRKDIYKHFP